MKELEKDKDQLETNIHRLIAEFMSKHNKKMAIDIEPSYYTAAISKKCSLVDLSVVVKVFI